MADTAILRLIKGWLRAPIVEEDRRRGVKRTVDNRCGTPQGGVISPLLASLYLDGLDKAVNGGRQTTPAKEISLTENRKHDYEKYPASDGEKYIANRRGKDSRFAAGFEEEWEIFRPGATGLHAA